MIRLCAYYTVPLTFTHQLMFMLYINMVLTVAVCQLFNKLLIDCDLRILPSPTAGRVDHYLHGRFFKKIFGAGQKVDGLFLVVALKTQAKTTKSTTLTLQKTLPV